jgi:hypothetical protein
VRKHRQEYPASKSDGQISTVVIFDEHSDHLSKQVTFNGSGKEIPVFSSNVSETTRTSHVRKICLNDL